MIIYYYYYCIIHIQLHKARPVTKPTRVSRLPPTYAFTVHLLSVCKFVRQPVHALYTKRLIQLSILFYSHITMFLFMHNLKIYSCNVSLKKSHAEKIFMNTFFVNCKIKNPEWSWRWNASPEYLPWRGHPSSVAGRVFRLWRHQQQLEIHHESTERYTQCTAWHHGERYNHLYPI